MIDTYVTILKSYADRAVPRCSLKTRLLEYMKMALLTCRSARTRPALSGDGSARDQRAPSKDQHRGRACTAGNQGQSPPPPRPR